MTTLNKLDKARSEAANLKRKLSGISEKYGAEKSVVLDKTFPQNVFFKDRHHGQRGYVLGNGPSLLRQQLGRLSTEVTITVNGFFASPLCEIVRPKYHVFSGYGVHPGVKKEIKREFYEKMVEIPGAHFILNDTDSAFVVDHLGGRPNFSFVGWERGWPKSVSDLRFDATTALYQSQSVSVMALQMAIVMGCNPIYLLGFDHDWILQYINDSLTHCYDPASDPHYRAGTTSPRQWQLIEQWRSYLKLWGQYACIGEWASANGVTIVNATDGGLLDTFPRACLADL